MTKKVLRKQKKENSEYVLFCMSLLAKVKIKFTNEPKESKYLFNNMSNQLDASCKGKE